MNSYPESKSKLKILILDSWTDWVYILILHMQPLLRVLLRRQERNQVQSSYPGLSSEQEKLKRLYI